MIEHPFAALAGCLLGVCIPVWGALTILTLRDSNRPIEPEEQSLREAPGPNTRVVTLSRYNPLGWLIIFLIWPLIVFSRRPPR